jgi:hypothetical protein
MGKKGKEEAKKETVKEVVYTNNLYVTILKKKDAI